MSLSLARVFLSFQLQFFQETVFSTSSGFSICTIINVFKRLLSKVSIVFFFSSFFRASAVSTTIPGPDGEPLSPTEKRQSIAKAFQGPTTTLLVPTVS